MGFNFKVQKAVREKIAVKIALMGPSGSGKALTLDSDLMTPDGIIKMGDVKVGDDVLGTDGEAHKVLGVYPQGKKECYRVTFSDGSYVDCSKDHLWTVRKRGNGNNFTTMPLSELLEKKIYDKGWVYFIPMTAPVKYTEKEQKIDPYVLGVLIGDGSLTINHALFTNSEDDIVSKVESRLDNDFELHCYKYKDQVPDYAIYDVNCAKNHGNKMVSYLKELNLIGCKSCDKFIPDNYKYGSSEQRIELLRGLIDTDGEVSGTKSKGTSSVLFSTTSEKLANDVKFIVNSLGGTANLKERKTRYTNKDGEKSEWFNSYRLYIKMPVDIIPFSSEKHYSVGYKPQTNAYRSIRSIEYLGELECQCITVDSDDHLFLTNDFVATHNTYSALRLADGMLKEMKKSGQLNGTNGRILFANTEGSRGRYYANEFDYDIVDLVPPYAPEQFTELINYAVAEKYSILIIDSTSAEWEGKGGCLELQQQAGGRYQDWKTVTPRHDKFIDTMQYSPIHIIATMKGKDQYEVDKDDRGRTAVKKLGVGAKQRDGFEYYFTTTFNIDVTSHMAKCEKDNTHIFENEGYTILSEDFGKKIIDWANSSDVEATSAKTFAQAPDYDGSGSVSETTELTDTISNIGSLAQALVGADKLSKTDLVAIIKKYHTSANYNSITDIGVAKNILAELEAKNS